jgi:CheY-like chemotaxis protein
MAKDASSFLPSLNFIGANKMSIRVLMVDHHEQIRRLVRAFFLSEFGFQICGEAVDGCEALMKAQILKPDLIVLEVAIPRLNGVEAAAKLRKLLAKQDGISALGASVHTLFARTPVTSTTKRVVHNRTSFQLDW